MRKTVLALALTAPVAVAGCMTPQQERQAGGALIGGSLGFITAKALGADSDWTVVSTLGGAAAGTLVARNTANNQCAYATGDGRYRRGPC
ncbi:MAG: glucose-6-phosphate isomerase [Roseovarius sp.]|uniref:glucose-6-phosphate isomerase n=1 Tax=Roseovarius sp. TaxID=1486281 RepID=UPI0032EC4FA5